jgi:hypothetical protein
MSEDYSYMKCPKCESENTQRLEVVFHGGTQNISTTSNSAGIGIGSGGRIGFGGGVTTTSGQTQSTLAAACAPPVKKKADKKWLLVLVSVIWPIMALQAHWIFFVISLILIGFVWKNWLANAKYIAEEWPKLYQHWAESWLCHKCGGIYHQA